MSKLLNRAVLLVTLSVFAACDGHSNPPSNPESNPQNNPQSNSYTSPANAAGADQSAASLEPALPIFMLNEPDTLLYAQPATTGKVLARLSEPDTQALICLSAVTDAANQRWYRCYYPREQLEGWTQQVSHHEFPATGMNHAFMQTLSLAYLQLGATPREAKRLLGPPQSEQVDVAPEEVSGYLDEETSVTTITLTYAGLHLVYADDQLIHATINQPGKGFGQIVCGDPQVTTAALMQAFNLSEEHRHSHEDGGTRLVMGGFLSLTLSLDERDMVTQIVFNTGP